MDCIELNHYFKQEEIDKITADELEIFMDNEEKLYRNKMAWLKNFARKMKRNVYDTEKAIYGIEKNFVPTIIKEYDGIELKDVNRETRNYLAKNIIESIENEIKIDYGSNYDKIIKDLSGY